MSADSPFPAVLLDTCAAIWFANGAPLNQAAFHAIIAAVLADGVFVSPISAWEIGFLSRPRKAGAPTLEFQPDPKTWFARLMAGTNFKAAPLTPDIAIDSAYLPGNLHNDPGDRLLIATARHLGMPLITRDARILAYAGQGHVQAISC
jgi:PIN domain nuclease of toxin-antitoxin system